MFTLGFSDYIHVISTRSVLEKYRSISLIAAGQVRNKKGTQKKYSQRRTEQVSSIKYL